MRFEEEGTWRVTLGPVSSLPRGSIVLLLSGVVLSGELLCQCRLPFT